MRNLSRVSSRAAALLASVLITGCGAGFANLAPSGAGPTTLGTITGTASGGRQPINGARVYLLTPNTTAYAGPGITASNTNQSISLLTSGAGSDSIGTYVLTTNGSFTITGDYATCPANAPLYLYASGGDTGAGVPNTAAGLMAVIGTCGSISSATTVNMNEVSTIAAAYAMAGFASDATHVGYLSSPLALTGITNAFANAGQLYDISSNPYNGTAFSTSARTTTPSGNGTVPQAQIDTLANILAACVNTAGPSSGACNKLFTNLMSSGITGTQANDTATEAIYMAHNPGVNVATVYSVTGSGAQPYTPWFSTQAPADFTVAISFTGGGLNSPIPLAADSAGYLWVGNVGDNSLSEFSNLGTPITSSGGYTGAGFNQPSSLALSADSSILWVANSAGTYPSNGSVSRVMVANEAITSGVNLGAPGGINVPFSIAIDPTGGVWLANYSTADLGSITGLDSSGSALAGSPFLNGTFNGAVGIAIDPAGNVWAAGDKLVELSSTGALLDSIANGNSNTDLHLDAQNRPWVVEAAGSIQQITPPSTIASFSGGGLSSPFAFAFDGNGSAWIPNGAGNSLSAFTSTGAAITTTAYIGPSSAYNTGTLHYPVGIAMDGSGNAWITNNNATPATLTEFVGIGAPVATPIAYGVLNSKLAQRP